MADVFLSYASQDRDLAIEVARFLEANGLSVWWDTNLLGGQSYRDAITGQIDSAKAVVVLWTPTSIESEWVLYEADRGNKLGKLVLLRTPDLDPSDIPPPYPAAAHVTSIEDQAKVLQSVKSLIADDSAPGSSTGRLRLPQRFRRSMRWLLAGGAVAVLMAGLAGVLVYTRPSGTAAVDPVFEQLTKVYGGKPVKHSEIKTATLAHWAVESQFGKSELARQHFNFSNMPWQETLGTNCAKVHVPPSSPLAYCRFSSLDAFIDTYWKSIEDMPDAKFAPADAFLAFLAQRWAPGKPAYFEQVKLTARALDASGWQGLGDTGPKHPPVPSTDPAAEVPKDLLVRKKPGEKRVALLVAHDQKRPGAFGSPPFSSEYDMSQVVLKALASELKSIHGIEARVFFQDDVSREQRNLHVYLWQADLALELHGNAATGKASGSETLFDARYGEDLARIVQTAVVKSLGRTGRGDRGMRAVEPGGRGFNSVSNWNTPTILLEPFFIDNPDEVKLFVERRTIFVRDLALAIRQYLNELEKMRTAVAR